MPIPESKFKRKITACVGTDCPMSGICKLFCNLQERDVWERIRAEYNPKSGKCPNHIPR